MFNVRIIIVIYFFQSRQMGICESVLCGGHPSDLRRVREVQGLSTKTKATVTRVSGGVDNIENGEAVVLTKTNGVLSSAATGNSIPFVKWVLLECIQ